jgi:hypothetical protein
MIAATAPELNTRPEDHCTELEEQTPGGRKSEGLAQQRKKSSEQRGLLFKSAMQRPKKR